LKQWRSQEFVMRELEGAGGHCERSPKSAGSWESGDKASSRRRQGEPPALEDFCNFSIKITYFRHN